MRKPSSWSMLVVAIFLGLIANAAGDDQSKASPSDQPPTPPYAILHAPAGVKEGEKWIPEMPAPESLAPPPGWKPDGREVPWMPATLLRLPRTNITRAKYPAIDFHNHTGVLTTKEQYEQVISMLDRVGIGAVVNLNAGTEDQLEAVLKAGEPYKERVANFLTFNPAGINEPGWSARFAAIMERGFKAGAQGMKVFKSLSTAVQNPDGIIKYQDRVLFGTDGNGNSDPDTFWNPHFRYLETYDEYFEHPAQIRTPGGSPGHGRWNISGIGLPPEVLRKVYYENALKYLPSLRPSITRQLAAGSQRR